MHVLDNVAHRYRIETGARIFLVIEETQLHFETFAPRGFDCVRIEIDALGFPSERLHGAQQFAAAASNVKETATGFERQILERKIGVGPTRRIEVTE